MIRIKMLELLVQAYEAPELLLMQRLLQGTEREEVRHSYSFLFES